MLKTRHIAGVGARAAAAGLSGSADANGTAALKYYYNLQGSSFNSHFVILGADGFSGHASAGDSLRAGLPTYGKSPEVQIPLGSGLSSGSIKVHVSMADAGQDVRDRGVAHIVTGGLVRA